MTTGNPPTSAPLIVLFDGECALCHGAVQFILSRDPARRFRFAPLRSPIARDLLAQHHLDPDTIDSMVLIDNDRAYLKSNAALRIALELPEPWPLAGAAVFIPEPLRNAVYDFIARHRKQWFNTAAACPVPTEQQREQFLA